MKQLVVSRSAAKIVSNEILLESDLPDQAGTALEKYSPSLFRMDCRRKPSGSATPFMPRYKSFGCLAFVTIRCNGCAWLEHGARTLHEFVIVRTYR